MSRVPALEYASGVIAASGMASAIAGANRHARGGSPPLARPVGPAAPPRPRPKVLWIDDDPYVCGYAEKCLPEMGFEVIVAKTGAEGLRLMCQQTADVIVLDLRLGKVHGTDLLRERASLQIPTPVVILTGHPDDLSPEDAVRLGAAGYLIKPVVGARLTATLRRALSHSPRLPSTVDHLREALDGFVGQSRRRTPSRPSYRSPRHGTLISRLIDVLLDVNVGLLMFLACAYGLRRVLSARHTRMTPIAAAVRRLVNRAHTPVSALDANFRDLLAMLEGDRAKALRMREEEIAGLLGLTPTKLSRLLPKHAGFHDLRRGVALRLTMRPLALTERALKAIAIDCGFAGASQFSRVFHDIFGMSPTAFRALCRSLAISTDGAGASAV